MIDLTMYLYKGKKKGAKKVETRGWIINEATGGLLRPIVEFLAAPDERVSAIGRGRRHTYTGLKGRKA